MQAPYNEFGHVRKLAGPELKFVSPNNDTCYSIAICDVRQGPLVLDVPDTADRYYVLQFVDAWTNNFAYIGRRATGTAEASYLLAEHDYAGAVPDGMRVVHAPTGVFVIEGRVHVDDDADLPAVHALQDQLTLTPLSVHMGGSAPAPVAGVPSPDPRVGEELEWWERFRVALRAFPPPAADAPFLKLCEQFGLTQADSPYVGMDSARAAVLVAGQKAGQTKIEELMKQIHATPEGWQSSMHLFDYNLDYFEIGAIDAPEWKIADRARAYVTRAVVARAGLWGNHGYEANYGLVWVDAENQLDGSKRYELVPRDATSGRRVLVADDVRRARLLPRRQPDRAVLDRRPHARPEDGGRRPLTIYLQKDSPGPDKESNWLPTPARAFRPIMRMYQPRKEILDGTYVLPAIRQVT